jgi:hypothetical protein
VWQTDAESGTVYPGFPGGGSGAAYSFNYPTADCSGSAVYFTFGYQIPLPRYTFYGTNGEVYITSDTALPQKVTLLGERTAPTSVSGCSSENETNPASIALSDCIEVGTTTPTSLFVAPAHPEVVQ